MIERLLGFTTPHDSPLTHPFPKVRESGGFG
jgi:hypothetical protein